MITWVFMARSSSKIENWDEAFASVYAAVLQGE
jgi:hypothetical protein